MKIKILAVFILMLCGSTTTYAQRTKEKEFLTWFFTKHEQTKEPILYVPAYWPGGLKEIKESLGGDTIYNKVGVIGKDDKLNGLVLSKKERKFVDRKIQELRKQSLADRLLSNARLISQDTIDHYLSDRGYGWLNLYKKKIYGYYSLTTPIFLRKNTICIFTYGYNCGPLCGNGGTSVYRLEKGEWKEWIFLSYWIS